MKFSDMLQTSASNLWKRKLRSALTIMGVVIGVASIVIMVSLGLGLSRSMLEEYESWGSLTQITVQTPYNASTTSTEYRLTDNLVSSLSSLEHVESVYPELLTSAYFISGPYSAYLSVRGLPEPALDDLGINVGEGTLPRESDDQLLFFYGNSILQSFSNTKTQSDYWSTGVLPNINLMTDPIFTVFDTNNYSTDSSNGSSNKAKKYIIPTAGVEAPSEESSRNGWYVYCEINQLKTQLKRVFKKNPIPGQPTMKNGKAYSEIYYTSLLVNVDKMENVAAVQSAITDMGYSAYSQSEWVQSSMQSMNLVQGVLGGIGAVSLLVAAIGIVNTMMMSIYERTREIGVMKVLGCSLENIRNMFLMEAGMIGFVGGIIGVIVSYIASRIINYVSQGASFMGIQGSASGLSRIPLWLAFLSIIFAVIISMIAGFFPSQKAMKLSPLAAIRNE